MSTDTQENLPSGIVRGNVKTAGFSLVELLVVIAIIAVLSVSAYVAYGVYIPKAKDAKRKEDLEKIDKALSIYYYNNNERYPDALSDIPTNILPKIPKDPSGHDYVYFVKNNREYQLLATLEIDGKTPHFETYLIGKYGEFSFDFCSGCGFFLNTATDAFFPCNTGTGQDMKNGQIATNDTATSCEIGSSCSCIPYIP